MHSNSYLNIVATILLLAIGVNLLILDIKVFSHPQDSTPLGQTISKPEISPPDNLCPQGCLNLISKLSPPPPQPSLSSYPTSYQPQVVQPIIKTPHEYYIPLGSGSTQSNTWEDQTSTDTTIDPTNYGVIKEAYFIAILRNPTQNGQIDAQLYDVTDKHPVWFSQISSNGPAVQSVTSGKISLENGPKLYRVQLKSTIQAPVTFDSARIRIVTE